MCTEEFIRMMFTVDLYGNRGLDSSSVNQPWAADAHMLASALLGSIRSAIVQK